VEQAKLILKLMELEFVTIFCGGSNMKLVRSLFLIAAGIGFNVTAFADEDGATKASKSTDHHSWRIESVQNQQEVTVSALSVFSPSLGDWGQFGIYTGSKHYDYVSPNTGKLTNIANSELALAWRFGGRVVNDFGLYSTLRAGKSSYKIGSTGNDAASHGFYDIELLPTFDVIPAKKSWVSRFDVGVGVGIRSNFVNNDLRIAGSARIPSTVIYPAFNVGLEF